MAGELGSNVCAFVIGENVEKIAKEAIYYQADIIVSGGKFKSKLNR